MPKENVPEIVSLSSLKPHPRNYKSHPEDQIAHVVESIRANGVYKNVVAARDNTILAGHGVVKAAEKLGLESIPVIRLDLDPNDPRALKIVAGDNEIGNLAEVDDRALAELLKEVMAGADGGLLGTGFDEAQLAALAMVTRPASEIADINEAAEWVGMPEYVFQDKPLKVIVSLRSEDDVRKLLELLGAKMTATKDKVTKTWSIWWPQRVREDLSAVKFSDAEEANGKP